MTFQKTTVARMNAPYAITSLVIDGALRVACATEDHGPALIMAPPWREARTLVPGPGGCMSLLPDRKNSGQLFAIMGCFPGYKFQGAGIFQLRGGGSGSWAASRIFDLPFAHRIETVESPTARWIVAANLAADKSDPSDWSKPGAVWAARLSDDGDPRSGLEPVVKGIHKNHGLLLTRMEGRSALLIGGTEGLFSIDVQAVGPKWPTRQITTVETSEMAVLDLDADRADELATIEPFHGNALRVYKHGRGGWSVAWEGELSFGHCVLGCSLGGAPGLLVGNRAGDKSLLFFRFDKTLKPERIVVDHGVGPANMAVLDHGGKQRIFSTNQATGEIAMYTVA
ncbi:MAG TPA: hypothetical protein VMV03_08200 [Spirochaetia bacterium]|nr:hypothetical protein [Spirochaetia bacterium]